MRGTRVLHKGSSMLPSSEFDLCYLLWSRQKCLKNVSVSLSMTYVHLRQLTGNVPPMLSACNLTPPPKSEKDSLFLGCRQEEHPVIQNLYTNHPSREKGERDNWLTKVHLKMATSPWMFTTFLQSLFCFMGRHKCEVIACLSCQVKCKLKNCYNILYFTCGE